MMERREFITLLGGAAAWPLAAGAQQGGTMRRVGVLMNSGMDDEQGKARLAAFLQGLQQLGWTEGRNYRSRVVVEPRAVLKEFGTELPDSVILRTHDSNADMRYLVLPERPAGTESWSEPQLAAIITRDCMVGVAVPKVG